MKINRYIAPKFRHRSIFNFQLATIMSNTKDNESIPMNHIKITEGSAHMYYDKKEAVFYNKVQVLNRDLSIQVIKLFSEVYEKEKEDRYQKKVIQYNSGRSSFDHEPTQPLNGISVLDALAATGLRSIRYMKEIPLLRKVTINDLSKEATDVAQNNIRLNNADITKCEVTNRDATILMYEHRSNNQTFDVIDLDPYGSASIFLDSAVQSVSNGGLLCVTCTDMTVLAGTYPEVCFAKYGSVSLKSGYKHEMSLRILLNAIESAATKYKRHIVPWLSMSIDYYVRVFVRVYESPVEVKNTCIKRIMLYQSTQCPNFHIQPLAIRSNPKDRKASHIKSNDDNDNKIEKSDKDNTNTKQMNWVFASSPVLVGDICPESGSKWKIGGPFWGDPIHNQEIVDELLKRVTKDWGQSDKKNMKNQSSDESNTSSVISLIPTASRLVGLLTTISEELKDSPFFYLLPELASVVGIGTPARIEVESALINAGYRVSQFHHEPSAIKTDAPSYVVFDIIRELCKKTPPVSELSIAGTNILSKEIITKINFKTVHSKALHKKGNIARFPSNPEPNWGPKRKAGKIEKLEKKSNNNDKDDYNKDNCSQIKIDNTIHNIKNSNNNQNNSILSPELTKKPKV